MLVTDYDKFVRETDQFSHRPASQREDIAIYGLVGEIGSIVAAVKKQLLQEAGPAAKHVATDEIKEELGDAMWYCFSLSQIANLRTNVLVSDIVGLRLEIGARTKRARIIAATLDPNSRASFLRGAARLPKTERMVFRDYQRLAFKTARTKGKVLLQVCLVVLWQLGAELLRRKLPDIEKNLNTKVADRQIKVILGEIAWHISAIATLYKLSLDEIAEANVQKVSFRRQPGPPTPLHDSSSPSDQRLPRQFEVAFVTIGRGRTRMYLNGRQLGDELTDNYYEDDGYRFHDVFHLANAAKLGWSPVFRSLVGRKRKHLKKVDEVEDGARARIVEEAIVKIAHSEGVRLAKEVGVTGPKPIKLFADRNQITFRFLKQIHDLTVGLEAEKNKYGEWEAAIVEGHHLFYELCKSEGGTITVDLDARSISYKPEVYVDLVGSVAGIGSAMVEQPQGLGDTPMKASLPEALRTRAIRTAILESLGMTPDSDVFRKLVDISELQRGQVAVRARGAVRERMWERKVVTFRVTTSSNASVTTCTAIAISDAKDSIEKS